MGADVTRFSLAGLILVLHPTRPTPAVARDRRTRPELNNAPDSSSLLQHDSLRSIDLLPSSKRAIIRIHLIVFLHFTEHYCWNRGAILLVCEVSRLLDMVRQIATMT